MQIPHWQEPDRVHPVGLDRLPADLYGQALDHLVIACVDVLLTCGQEILLAKRRRPPRPSWWVVGGRMQAGEDPLVSAQRKVREETELCLDLDRFGYVGVMSTCFAQRHQPPQQHGLHSMNLTYRVELTPTEQTQLQLIPSEYDSWIWARSDQLRTWLNPQTDVMDRALVRLISEVMET